MFLAPGCLCVVCDLQAPSMRFCMDFQTDENGNSESRVLLGMFNLTFASGFCRYDTTMKASGYPIDLILKVWGQTRQMKMSVVVVRCQNMIGMKRTREHWLQWQ